MEPTEGDVAYAKRWAHGWARTHRQDWEMVEGYALEALVILGHRYRPGKLTWPQFVRSRLRYATIDLLRQHEGFNRDGRVRANSWRRPHASIDTARNLADPRAAAAFELAETVTDAVRALAPVVDCLPSLPEMEATVLVESYLEGRTLADIGARHGIGESMACRLRQRAVARVRRLLAAPLPRPPPAALGVRACRRCGVAALVGICRPCALALL